jgi:hypothetical protein
MQVISTREFRAIRKNILMMMIFRQGKNFKVFGEGWTTCGTDER